LGGVGGGASVAAAARTNAEPWRSSGTSPNAARHHAVRPAQRRVWRAQVFSSRSGGVGARTTALFRARGPPPPRNTMLLWGPPPRHHTRDPRGCCLATVPEPTA